MGLCNNREKGGKCLIKLQVDILTSPSIGQKYKRGDGPVLFHCLSRRLHFFLFDLTDKDVIPPDKLFISDRYIHSFSSLSYDRSKTSSKANSPHSAIQSFLFQMRVSSPFLKVIQQLLTSSSLSSCHFYPPLYLSFSNALQKAVSTQNVNILKVKNINIKYKVIIYKTLTL